MPTKIARETVPPARRSLLLAFLACNLAAAGAFALDRAGGATRAAPGTATEAATGFDHDVKGSVQYLASDDLEGRGIGTAGIDKAAEYIAANFRKIGLQTPAGQEDYFQPFKMTTAGRPGDKTVLKFTGGEGDDDSTTYDLGDDYIPLSFSGEKQFDAPLVFVGYSVNNPDKNYNDFENIDVKGKVAVALRYEPHDNQGRSRFTGTEEWSPSATLARKADAAAAAGAVALVIANPPAFHEEDDPLVPFAFMYRGEQSKIPVIQAKRSVVGQWLKSAGSDDLRALQRRIDDNGKPGSFALPDSVRLSGTVEVERVQAGVKNVVGVLPGSGNLAHEYVVVGAHYDHLGKGGMGSMAPRSRQIHNGADDNASGTAALLELAEHFARNGSGGRSIVFAAFTAEEVGLVGSQHFVTHPPVPLARIAYMINLDMVGRIRNDILYVGGHGTAEGVLDKAIAEADEKSPLRFKSFGKGGFGPSDHMSFAMKKVPVLFFHSGQHRDYHSPTDDADKVNYKGIEQAVAFAADVIGDLAAAPRAQYVDAADAHSMFNGPGSGDREGGPARSASGGIRVSLGVVPDYAPDDEIKGMRISGTSPGSPAAAAGLKEGDVLVQINDDKITSVYDLTDVLQRGKPGQKVKIAFMRDGKRVETETTLVERKSTPIDAGSSPHGENPHGATPHGATPQKSDPHGGNPHGTEKKKD